MSCHVLSSSIMMYDIFYLLLLLLLLLLISNFIFFSLQLITCLFDIFLSPHLLPNSDHLSYPLSHRQLLSASLNSATLRENKEKEKALHALKNSDLNNSSIKGTGSYTRRSSLAGTFKVRYYNQIVTATDFFIFNFCFYSYSRHLSFAYIFIYLFIHSFIYLFIYLFIY